MGNGRYIGVIQDRHLRGSPRYGGFNLPYSEPETEDDEKVWQLLSHLGPKRVYSTTLLKCSLVSLATATQIQKPGPVALDWTEAEKVCSTSLDTELLTEPVDLWLSVGMAPYLHLLRGLRNWEVIRTVQSRPEWSLPTAPVASFFLHSSPNRARIVLLPAPMSVEKWPEVMAEIIDSIKTT